MANPVAMLAPGTGRTQTARLWTYARDERPWRGETPPAALYRFSGDRKGRHPRDHLAGFRGWMHADGYAGFEDLYRGGDIREVACMAHIRRKFVDVHRAQGSPIAEEAIRRIAELYAVEKAIRGSPPDRRVEIRQAKARPIFEDLEAWLARQLTAVSGKSPLAAAIRYALTRMAASGPTSSTASSSSTTMRPNAQCVLSRSAGRTTCSSAQHRAARRQPSPTP
jgi:transposase